MSTIRMEMRKMKKILKNKEKCRKYYEKKREEGTNAKNRKCHCGYSETLVAVKKRKQRQYKAEKRLKETERKRKYRNKVKTNSQATPINDLENSFSNRMQKSRAVQSVKQALPTTTKKRVAVMASYLDNKHSPTVKSLEKLNFVVSQEDKTNTQLGNAVINDIRELVDQTKNSRSDCARTTLSVIAASTSGLNAQKEHKKCLLAKKIDLPLKRLSTGKRVRTQIFNSEKSCWTFIERKTRNDCISDEIRKLAYNFWIDPNNSRPSGNKNDMKRVRIGPKQFSKHLIYILDKPQTEVLMTFVQDIPT
jgi:hypothetical protein